MATIPLGSFGRVTPGRVPSVSADQTARAIEQAGRVGVQIGTQFRADQQHVDDMELRRQQEQAEQTERAKEAAALNEAADRLQDLHDDIGAKIINGEVPRDQAEKEFNLRAREAVDGVMPQFREQNRAIVGPRLQREVARLGNGVRRAVEKRGRMEVTSSITKSLEYFERMYRDDPVKAEQMAAATIEQMAPWSDLTPDQAGKLGQGWKERTQFTAGYEAVSAGRNDRKALEAAEQLIAKLPDLDPQKKAQLADRAQAYRLAMDQKAELEAQRAQRRAEAALKKAEATFNAASALADKGVLAPEYADKVLTQLAGTPYQDAFRQLAVEQYNTAPLAAMPISQQRAELDALNARIAQSGLTPELDKKRSRIEKVVRGSEEDVNKDPLRAGLERGVIDAIAPVDVSSPQAIANTVRARLDQAQAVSTWAGRPVSPLTEQEAQGVKVMLDTLPAKDKAGAVATLATSIGPQASAGLAAQLDKKDRALALAFALAGSKTTEGRNTSELLLKGQQAKADGTSTKGDKAPDVKAAGWRAHAAAELDGVFANQQTTGQIRDAAELIMHGIAAEQGGRLTKDDMDRAVRLALGGSLLEHNGRKIPLPAGVEPDAFEKRLRSVTAAELQAPGGKVRAGGVEVPVEQFVATLPGQQLMPVRPGEYAVLVGGRPVINALGKPVTVTVR